MDDNSKYAFPSGITKNGPYGMLLRDYFAGQALIGISSLSAHPQSPNIEGQAKLCYEIADAMIKEREKCN